jgi:hypothetical protein
MVRLENIWYYFHNKFSADQDKRMESSAVCLPLSWQRKRLPGNLLRKLLETRKRRNKAAPQGLSVEKGNTRPALNNGSATGKRRGGFGPNSAP